MFVGTEVCIHGIFSLEKNILSPTWSKNFWILNTNDGYIVLEQRKKKKK